MPPARTVGRGAACVERRDGQERRRVGRDREREVHAVRGQRRTQPRAGRVRRQPADERHRGPEARQGSGRRERTAARDLHERAVRPDDPIDEALAGDDDPVPRLGHATRTTPTTLGRPGGTLVTGYPRGVDRLTGVLELLDGSLDDERALVGNLRDLARLNRLTGGARLSQRAITALGAGGDAATTTILDVGTGAADIPMTLLAAARREGRSLVVTATDSREEVLAAARLARPALTSTPGLDLAMADGRGLTFADGTFDVAHASMVVHHLDPDAAVAFLRELRRVARRGIVMNDLVRGRLNWLGAWLLIHATATSRFTRHDGPLSVRRAYTRPELLDLVAAAGLEPVVTVAAFAGHRVAIAAR